MEHTRTLNYLVKNESIVGCKLTLRLKMFMIPLLIGFASLYYSALLQYTILALPA